MKQFILAPCDSNPCVNSGVCNVLGNTFTCKCPPGYTGVTCETNIRPCKFSINNLFNYSFFFFLAICNINCSPGYCFSNPASQPPYACYCTDHTIQLRDCTT
jgi:hypothetical protein